MGNHFCPFCKETYEDECMLAWYDKPHKYCEGVAEANIEDLEKVLRNKNS